MTEGEDLDTSFLPGQSSAGKKAIYEPDGVQRCKQIVFSTRKATLIVVGFIVAIIIIALIAALSRTGCNGDCFVTTPTPLDAPGSKVTPAMSTSGEPFPWSNIRLPEVVVPLTYELFLHPNLTTFRYTGNVSIVLSVKQQTSFFIYHVKQLEIISQAVIREGGSSAGKKVDIKKKHLEYVNHEQMYVELTTELSVGDTVRLNIVFNGTLTDNLAGFYRSSYDTSTGEKRWLGTTHFEATDARAAFPCFDEPQLKANFTLSMVRDQNYICLFNTELLSTADYGTDNHKVDHFATSVTMSTYLVAFVVCDFGQKSAMTKSGVKVSVYAPKEMLNLADFALNVSRDVLDFYEEYYDIKYPLAKSDHIAIPDFSAGAMENWGLVTYLMRSLLYDPQESSVSDQQWVAVVVAHELAHQWFGNLVTMKWWNDLWLNEGFARFVEYLGANSVQPDWQMPDLFIDDALSVALYSDGLASSHPISVPVKDPAEIGEIFDAISYEKGASVIRMLQTMIGEDKFKAGVRAYLRSHMFGNAETDDLWAAMTRETKNLTTPIDIKSIMDTWTLQMGYPVITVSRTGGLIHATQERFLYNPRANLTDEFNSSFGYKWFVPLTYITETTQRGEIHPVQWMNKGDVRFSVDSQARWVKMNANMTGVYRVHYNKENWDALILQLNTDHEVFTPADRASLIADSFALARSGHLNITVFMDLTGYLTKEVEYIPWQTALACLSYIGDLLEGEPDYDYFNMYARRLIANIQKNLTWNDSGTHVTRLLRASILSEGLKLGVEENVKMVKEMFDNWSIKNISVGANLRSLVYWGGVRYGGNTEWEAVWKRFVVTRTPSEKSKLLAALSATTDALRLTRFLKLSLDEKKVRSAETPSVIQSVASNPAGRVLSWRFVRANWDILYGRYHNVMMKLKRIFVGATSHFSTQFDYDEVKRFFTEHLLGENLRSVSQALDKIEMNIDWMARNKETVVDWLKEAANQ